MQPYIVKHIFAQSEPPVNLKKIAIGDGSLGSFATIRHLPVVWSIMSLVLPASSAEMKRFS